MPGNQAKCTSIEDLFLLLKSSDRIMPELGNGEEPLLVLKKWYNLLPSQEFRVFLLNTGPEAWRIVAIHQRSREPIIVEGQEEQILEFAQRVMKDCPIFNINGDEEKNLVLAMDVYLERKGKSWIVDFGPFEENPWFGLSDLLKGDYLGLVTIKDAHTAMALPSVDSFNYFPLEVAHWAVTPSSSSDWQDEIFRHVQSMRDSDEEAGEEE